MLVTVLLMLVYICLLVNERVIMSNCKNKPEPKKIKLPPLVDRSQWYDTMSWVQTDLEKTKTNEDNSQNDSQGLPELES